MSVDQLTTEQRRGIHERGRLLGYREGLSSGVNQLASYLGPAIGQASVYALTIGMEAKDVSKNCQRRFQEVVWPTLAIATIEDMTLADDALIGATQANEQFAVELIRAIDLALPVFNLQRS